MPISAESAPFFTHAYFVQAGVAYTSPTPGIAGLATKPDPADQIWFVGSLGDIEEFTLTPESEEFEKMGGRPGGLVVTDVIPLSKKLKLKWTVNDASPLAHQLAFGTLPLNGASNTGNPLEGDLLVKGWLRFQAYAGQNLRVTGELWVRLKASTIEPWSGKNVARVQMEATTIHSPLNTLKFE